MKNKEFADLIRYYTLKELGNIGYGHYGGALSIVECLAVLYNSTMTVNPENAMDKNRDYLILSKGHAGPSYYAALALKGFISKEQLYTLNANGTNLPSHPDRQKVNGVDMTTGSLGQGLSVAAGLGYHLKNMGEKNKVYCILGDGELNEGQVWEALMFINHHKLNNITIFVDNNKKQLDGYTDDICDMGSLEDKFRSFGYDTFTVNGKNCDDIENAVLHYSDRCKVIILDTIKGSGVPYIEDLKDNHHLRLSEKDKIELDAYLLKLEASLKERRLL